MDDGAGDAVTEDLTGPDGGRPVADPSPAAEVLRGMSFATYVASAVLALVILAVWSRSAGEGRADFPGRYLVALLPLLAAGWALDVRATEVGRAWDRRRL